jgi:exodeoxyribonuclease VII large subunit
MDNILSVFQLNTYIKRTFEQDFILKSLSVEGELSNFKAHGSGHYYFTLKDDKAQVSCVLFRSYTRGDEKELSDGTKVVVKGRVSVYEKTGQYQIYVSSIEKAGLGDLYVQFEALKKKLELEGLFDESHKQSIPLYAKRIGIVTSETGAAIRDIVHVAKRRYPYVELILYPSLVQGSAAKESIVEGIRYFNTKEAVDILIVGRGGGSIEDLWPFNEEVVARAIYESKIPIISAVGHETDVTIADFVSDLRAPTPSAAAELAVFDYTLIIQQLKQQELALRQKLYRLLEGKKDNLQHLRKRLDSLHPRQKLEDRLNYVEQLRLQTEKSMHHFLEQKQQHLVLLKEMLKGRSPLRSLESGAAYIEINGQRIQSVHDVHRDDEVELFMHDGKVVTKVLRKEVF